jgi:hypothetical protein
MEKYLIIIIIVIIFYYVCKCYTHPAPALQESFIEIAGEPLSLEQKSAQKTIEIQKQLERLFIAFYELVSEIKLLPETEETMKAFYALVTQVKTLKQTYDVVGVLETLVLQVKDYLQSVTPEISQILTQKLIQKLIQPLDILVRQVKIALP